MKKIIQTSNVPVTIVYDKKHRLDRFHAKRVRNSNVEFKPYIGGGHILVKSLKEKGVLNNMIEAAIL